MSVRTRPGLASSTVTPVPSRAAASESVSRDSAAFDVAYADQPAFGAVPHPAADVQHPAGPAGHHRRQHRVGEQERAAQVGLEHPPPVVRVGLPRRGLGALAQAGVAHQQVDRAEVPGDVVDGGPHLAGPGDVGRHRDAAPAGRGPPRRRTASSAGRGCAPSARRARRRPASASATSRPMPRPAPVTERDLPARGQAPRRTAPVRRAASATAASRAAVASSTVRVRSGARNRSA